jgi:valyl-tRNA synthetase
MKTEMEKNYDPAEYEDHIYNKWESSGYFNPDDLNVDDDAPRYSIVMPPPNVTGDLHAGHAATLSYQDSLIRFHRMQGFRTVWIPGTDHAAIATQAKVEKKILQEEGRTRYDLGRDKFLQRVEQFASDSHDNIVNQIRKMGSSCDWSREAYTLDDIRTKTVRRVFKAMYEDGLIYQGERIVNWCPGCHSTLSDDEVEYHPQQAKLYTFKYSHDFPIKIATTRPETKLGDTAVAVHPDDERYKDHIGKTFQVDFLGIPLNIRVIGDKSIGSDFGTGALGVTPAHSQADWELAEKHDLDMVRVIDEDGRIKEGFNEFSGLTTKEAKEAVVKKLQEADLLESEEDLENNISTCYRCDTAIEPIPSVQWFLSVERKIPKFGCSIKELCQKAVKEGVFGRDKIRIIPDRFEKHYFHWIDNLRDWCISRQIWYGHRVPVWYKKSSKFQVESSKVDESDVYVGIEEPTEEGWEQDKDTLDTWFSSGLWTFSTMASRPEDIQFEEGKLSIDSKDFKHFHPTNVLETGYDILFFWVARMIIMTTYAVEDIPFYDVYLHGMVLDGQGKKMSKSKGNVIDPLDMIDKHGADATRLSLMIGSTPGHDLCLSDEKIAGFQKFINKLWNISRFILSKTDPDPAGDLRDFSSDDLTWADKWILKKFQELIEEVDGDVKQYRFSQAGEKLKHYTWEELADWYLEITKFEDKGPKNEILLYILNNLLRMWHPFIPFVTEVIWQKYNDSLLLSENWAESVTILNEKDKVEADEFEVVRNVIGAIRNARAENEIDPGRQVEAVIGAGEYASILEDNQTLITSMRTGIKELNIQEKAEKSDQAIYTVTGKVEIYLLGAVDREKEKERITKEISGLEKQKESTEQKLNNEEFINKAPEPVVNKEKEKLENIKIELENLKKQLKDLKNES